jgi:hypothetical protein
VRPAFVPRRPAALRRSPDRVLWAAVRHRVVARAAPRAHARSTGTLPARTPEHTRNLVVAIGHREDAAGRGWVRVRLPVVRTGTTGWVPRRALRGYHVVTTHLTVDLRTLRATLRRAGRVVLRAPVAVGRAGWATPRGEFHVRNRLTRYASPAYGPIAFGTSARSRHGTGWPAGGFVGIHGTDRQDLVPGRVSHGCIRLRNADIRRLARRMPVGTPVTIRWGARARGRHAG